MDIRRHLSNALLHIRCVELGFRRGKSELSGLLLLIPRNEAGRIFHFLNSTFYFFDSMLWPFCLRDTKGTKAFLITGLVILWDGEEDGGPA